MPTAHASQVTKVLNRKVDIPEQPKRGFASTQVNLPDDIAEKIRAHAATIPDESLAKDGREKEPHATVKYGLRSDRHNEVAKVLKGEKPISAKLGPVSMFAANKEHPDSDVLKLDVYSPDLHRLNKKVGSLPHTDTFPNYHPHVTLAYVKPGHGKKFVGPVKGLTGQSLAFHSVRFSPKEGEPTDIPLKSETSEVGGDGVRRITGSADIPLNKEGEKQTEQLAAKITKHFDLVFSGPEQRMIETAQEFGHPIILKAFDAWKRGAYEGHPAAYLKKPMRDLMLNPDQKPPGKSRISGEPGESHNEFLKPLLKVLPLIGRYAKEGERILVVTSGGGLQAIDEYLKAGAPKDLKEFGRKEMAQQAYWSATGVLFRAENGGLKKVTNNEAPAVYFLEHSATAFNSPSDKKSGAKNVG